VQTLFGIFREAIRDEKGLVDVAYLSLYVVTLLVLGAITFTCLMTAWSFISCIEVLDIKPPILCRFDPQPLGIAVGAICGGFATALAALAAYMAATRPRPNVVVPAQVNVQDAGTVNVPGVKQTGLPSAIRVGG
jgi:hypothetical protein